MEKGVVSHLGYTAPAGYQNPAGLLGQGLQSLGFELPENFLPILGKDVHNGLSRKKRNLLVGIQDFSSGFLSQQPSHGAFAASGHANEGDVLQPHRHLTVDFLHALVVDYGAGEAFGCLLGLGNEHPETAGMGNAKGFCIQQELCAGGIIHGVQHPLEVWEVPEVHCRHAVSGIHPKGRGVDNDGSICVAMKILIIIRPGAGDHHDLGAQLGENPLCGAGCSAAAKNQSFFSCRLNAAFGDQCEKSEIVRIVAPEGSVAAPDNGVHHPQLLGRGGQLVQKGNDRFFVGHGHVDSSEIPVSQKIPDFLRLFFKEGVGVASEKTMDLGRVAVAQGPSQQSAEHQTTSV